MTHCQGALFIMWFLIIIAVGIFLFLIAFLHDYRLKTDEVKIRTFETSYSFKDSLLYGCKFKKKGAIFWTDFVEYSTCFAKVSSIAWPSPQYFYKFKGYTYKQCKEYNNRAYEIEQEAIKKRKADRCNEF